MNNRFVQFIFSIPVIGVVMYYVPIVGIIMLFIKYFGVNGSNRYTTASLCSSFGFLILIPKVLEIISKKFNISFSGIPVLLKIWDSPVYAKLVIVGFVFLIFGTLGLIFSKIRMRSYISKVDGVRIGDAESKK